ncbi:MAG: hypothetical protein KC656_06410 [Myxococcales bacterium]|nr:hypothetical protein [Myxococcales bacterium]MCB9669771.1 hypothetical protein [Alphaproteobacteria bacterium]
MLLALWMAATAGATEELAWTGLDFGLVRVFGEVPFTDPATLTTFPTQWNRLFRDEMVGSLGSRTKRTIRVDDVHLESMHEALDPAVALAPDGPSWREPILTRVDVVARVQAYPSGTPGMALTFIAEELNRPDTHGCFWVTWYDRAELFVHATERRCEAPGGIGFRNYWFGSVKRILAQMKVTDVPSPDQVLTLTEAEIAEAREKSAGIEERLAKGRARAEERAARAAEEQKAADMAAGRVPLDWVTIHVAPEGLGALKSAGVEFVVADRQAPAPTTVQVVSSGVVVASGASGGVAPDAECETAYGKTACGYGCTVAYGDVKCAQYPGGTCEVAYGKVACGFDCQVAYGDVKCARMPGGRCEVAYGKITCSQ